MTHTYMRVVVVIPWEHVADVDAVLRASCVGLRVSPQRPESPDMICPSLFTFSCLFILFLSFLFSGLCRVTLRSIQQE